MIISLTCVVADGSTPAGTIQPLYPRAQRLAVPRGEAITVNLVVVKQDRSAFNVTGCTIKLAVRRQLSDDSPMFTRTAVLGVTPTSGLAAVAIAAADTLGLIEKKDYLYDVQLTDGAGRRWQLVPTSTFHIEPIVSRPGEEPLPPLTDPETGAPIGPAGLSVLRGDGPPDDAEGRDGESYIDNLTGDLYEKAAGAWGDPFPLVGPSGADGGELSDDDPLPLGTASPGTGEEVPRWDHVHAHGNLAGGSLHAIAIAGGAAGFMSGTMAQDLATLVAADFGAQIDVVEANLSSLSSTVSGVSSDLSALTSTVSGLSSSLSSLSSTVSGLSSTVSSLSSTVAVISASYVPNTRSITPGAGLVGSAALDLSADRTLAVGAHADGSIAVNANDIQVGVLATDVQHGSRGGGGLHADVVAGGASGFMTGTMATQLAGALTDISTNTSNISSLTTTVGGHTTALSALAGVKYIVQVADGAVPAAQALGALVTGLLKSTNTTGVLSIAGAGSDYEVPITFTGGLNRSTNTVTVAAHGIDGTTFRQSAALSVVGNGTNALADVADITAGTDDFVLRRSGTSLGFGQVATGGLTDASVTAAKMFNLAGASVLGRSQTGAAGVMAAITGSTIGHVLTVQADNTLAFSAPAGGGSSYTFTNGLTDTSGTVRNDLITGKSGGQTVTGGTGSGDGLTLASTTDSTKGPIQIGATAQAVFNTNLTRASASGATLDTIKFSANTITVTGTTAITTAAGFNYISVEAPTITDGSAVTISDAATVTISDAPTAGGSVTITRPYALWVRAGVTRLDGNVGIGGSSPSYVLDVAKSSSGATVTGAIRNTSNTATSKALHLIEVAGTTADDAYQQFSISGGQSYVIGVDNSDGDICKWQSGSLLTTNTAGFYILTSTGIVGAGTEKPVSGTGQFFQVRASSTAPATGVGAWILNSSASGSSVVGVSTGNNHSARLVNMGASASGTTFGVSNNTGLGLVDSSSHLLLGSTGSTHSVYLATNSTERMQIDSAGNITVGTAALATTATDGFLYVSSSAGLPTGAPTAKTGRVAVEIDTTNSKFMAYFGGAWKGVALA